MTERAEQFDETDRQAGQPAGDAAPDSHDEERSPDPATVTSAEAAAAEDSGPGADGGLLD